MRVATKNINIVKAEYIEGYVLKVYFSDSTFQVIDFTEQITKLKGYYAKYKEIENFKAFKVEGGNLVWGKNWDLIFPNWQLYRGKIE
ncbi:MAG: DUF2442 domain-containing protein [Raineya sp.]|nr:DUF2442 domain-containing protein [Raineya sp.]MDW8296673.1 DUF2442 domain-containing protein [Raineya sp.]